MYQALYRKWRPRTFEDVVGQSHITDTLKRQTAAGRLSHAYLFTGTRGTGKTSCAKILARAVNCEELRNGDPCNACPACLGIENGSILDVLELDAASNNGVDQVRALRDEAVYTPAAVKKRVYIVDEVHMLSTPAFNALLKILEEPPAHLMFILATTELYKVPATIRSRCQQFSFKRILPGQIARRLSYVAQEEGIELTQSGAALLARLADGGLRDALSLLDQCSGVSRRVDEQTILDTLGLAGNLETANLMGQIAGRDTAAALETLGTLYANGKDVGAVLGELTDLARDLLLRKTAPRGGAVLLSGGYDEATTRALGEKFTASRLLQIMTRLQETMALLPRGGNRRTEAELCLICLCDEGLDESLAGLSARITRLEAQMEAGVPVQKQVSSAKPVSQARRDAPPWEEEERPPLPEEPPVFSQPPREEVPPQKERSVSDFWPSFAAGLKGKVSPSVAPYFNNPDKVRGSWKNGVLTLWVDSEFTKNMLNKPVTTNPLVQAAQARFGMPVRVEFKVGKPPVQQTASVPAAPEPEEDALNALLAFGEQFDNIIIQ